MTATPSQLRRSVRQCAGQCRSWTHKFLARNTEGYLQFHQIGCHWEARQPMMLPISGPQAEMNKARRAISFCAWRVDGHRDSKTLLGALAMVQTGCRAPALLR